MQANPQSAASSSESDSDLENPSVPLLSDSATHSGGHTLSEAQQHSSGWRPLLEHIWAETL